MKRREFLNLLALGGFGLVASSSWVRASDDEGGVLSALYPVPTNTGITAAIDAQGKVVATLPAYNAGALALSLRGADGLTPYARWGNALPLALCLALALSGMLGARRFAKPNPLE